MDKIVVKKVAKGRYEGSFNIEDPEEGGLLVDKLPAGVYDYSYFTFMGMDKILYTPSEQIEKYIDVVGGTVGKVMSRIESFFSEDIKKKHKTLGIVHKTGFILYGKPGTGKTVTSRIIMDKLAHAYDAVCVILPSTLHHSKSYELFAVIRDLKRLNRPVILFADECENVLRNHEYAWLTILDGNDSVNNFMFIGCTNHIDNISARITRPSRIEHLIEVTSIEDTVAKAYVDEKLNFLSADIRAGLVFHAVENGCTIDTFKNAIKDWYINTDATSVEAFVESLKSYDRTVKSLALADTEAEEDEDS
jgi:SpoVK/Ycf46/Vps4 family AAA+-type ATPase